MSVQDGPAASPGRMPRYSIVVHIASRGVPLAATSIFSLPSGEDGSWRVPVGVMPKVRPAAGRERSSRRRGPARRVPDVHRQGAASRRRRGAGGSARHHTQRGGDPVPPRLAVIADASQWRDGSGSAAPGRRPHRVAGVEGVADTGGAGAPQALDGHQPQGPRASRPMRDSPAPTSTPSIDCCRPSARTSPWCSIRPARATALSAAAEDERALRPPALAKREHADRREPELLAEPSSPTCRCGWCGATAARRRRTGSVAGRSCRASAVPVRQACATLCQPPVTGRVTTAEVYCTAHHLDVEGDRAVDVVMSSAPSTATDGSTGRDASHRRGPVRCRP